MRSGQGESRNRLPQRHTLILQRLVRDGRVSVNALAQEFRVSPATIRRDLEQLEEQGLLKRDHGGATAIEPALYEPFMYEEEFQRQFMEAREEKSRIGLAAAQFIEDGDRIAVTPGTTTMYVVRAIRNRRSITVLTNTVNLAMELARRPDIHVIVTGGSLQGGFFSLVGPLAEEALGRLFVDKVFIGVNGISAEAGLTANSPEQASANRLMAYHARRRIVVADHRKVGAVAFAQICPIRDVHVLITDSAAPAAELDAIRAAGVEVIVV